MGLGRGVEFARRQVEKLDGTFRKPVAVFFLDTEKVRRIEADLSEANTVSPRVRLVTRAVDRGEYLEQRGLDYTVYCRSVERSVAAAARVIKEMSQADNLGMFVDVVKNGHGPYELVAKSGYKMRITDVTVRHSNGEMETIGKNFKIYRGR